MTRAHYDGSKTTLCPGCGHNAITGGIIQAAWEAGLEPHRVANWLLETARLVHTWYHKHHVLGEAEPVMRARLALAKAAKLTLANGLRLLGIDAPERM